MTAAWRAVDGVLLLDKPVGMSSNHALQKAKRRLAARKAGHTGSLDPLASGLLPICLGEATKLTQFLLDADKTYRFTARLGVKTTTGDAEGEVIQQRAVPKDLNEERIKAALHQFQGTLQQIPPMYSALKQQGKRLYQLARQGIEVERPARTVTIHRLTLENWQQDSLSCEAICSKGTYIRTLAEDIGEALGCGAHVTVLRRTGIGPFREAQAISLAAVLDENPPAGSEVVDQLLAVDAVVAELPCLRLQPEEASRLCHGQSVQVGAAVESGLIRLYDASDCFLGIGEAHGRAIRPRRLLRVS